MTLQLTACHLCSAVNAPASYPNAVCRDCDAEATTLEGGPPIHASERRLDPAKPDTYQVQRGAGRRATVVNTDVMGDYGTNPVFIRGTQCWRRYRFGGWVTMGDPDDCMSLEDFYAKHRSAPKAGNT